MKTEKDSEKGRFRFHRAVNFVGSASSAFVVLASSPLIDPLDFQSLATYSSSRSSHSSSSSILKLLAPLDKVLDCSQTPPPVSLQVNLDGDADHVNDVEACLGQPTDGSMAADDDNNNNNGKGLRKDSKQRERARKEDGNNASGYQKTHKDDKRSVRSSAVHRKRGKRRKDAH